MGKHGDPNNLEDYKGGRSFADLKKFADDNLGSTCGPNNLDLCDEAAKATIGKLSAMSVSELDAMVKEEEDAVAKAESDLKTFVEGLQKQYEDATKKKEELVAAAKKPETGFAKAVAA